MKTVRRQNSSLHSLAVACAFLFALVLPASAVKTPDVISRATIARLYYDDGSVADLFKDHGNRVNELFDYNFADTNAVYVSDRDEKSCVFLDFPDLPEINHAEHKGVYVSEIVVGHVSNCTRAFSLYWSDTVTNKTTTTLTWHPVEGAQNVVVPGVTNFPVKSRALYVKYVFETTGSDSLCELQVKGWISDMPHVVSKASLAKMYFSDGTMTGNNGTEGFGGGSNHGTIGHFFDGIFNEGVHIGPNNRLDNGGYLQLDFSGEMPGGYFIPEIRTGSETMHSYSLYYSMDGTTWPPVPDATGVKSTEKKTFPLNETAVYVRCVFDQIGGWTATFAELEVWGMDPDDLPCTHPSWTPWEPVEGTATCLKAGIDEQFCTVCGERVTRESSTLLPLGHDLVSHLDRAGAFKRFGSGYIACSRGDWRLDFPHNDDDPTATQPLNLITNRVNGTRIGRIAVDEQFNFTDVVCTSTGNSAEEPNPNNNWGNTPASVIDDTWTWTWQRYWYARVREDQHVDYTFATEVDLAWIDISVWNVNHTNYFYSVDDDTGEETLLADFMIRRYDRDEGVSDQYHVYMPAGEDPPPDIYGDRPEDLHDCLIVEKDEQLPSRKHDEEGNEIPDDPNTTNKDEGDNNYNQHQRMIIRFYEQPIKHLRIRQSRLNETMRLSECHPWGTVRGAGDLRYRKETIMIFK